MSPLLLLENMFCNFDQNQVLWLQKEEIDLVFCLRKKRTSKKEVPPLEGRKPRREERT